MAFNLSGRRKALFGGAAAIALLASPALADDLREALVMAYKTNPTLLAARAQQRAIDENVVIERSDQLPAASASASYSEVLKSTLPTGVGPDRQMGATVTQVFRSMLAAGFARASVLPKPG